MESSYKKLDNDNERVSEYWNIAIGLQKVDDLEPSSYLLELKEKNEKNILINEEIENLLYNGDFELSNKDLVVQENFKTD